MAADEQLLSEVSLFKLLDKEETRALAAVTEHKNAAAKTVLFQSGDVGDCLYIVSQGKVELFVTDDSGNKISLAILGAGEIFGELSLLDNGPRTATAIVLEESEFLVLDREDLLRFLEQKPQAAMDLLSMLGARIRLTDELLRGQNVKNANEEIAEVLSLGDRIANTIAIFSGSMPFLFINAIFFFVWIVINLGYVPGVEPFDPYPFGFLTMAVSLESIFLAIFVLLAQNLQVAKDRIRSDVEYDVNVRSELKVSHLHEKLDRMNAEVLRQLHDISKVVNKNG